MYRILIKPFFDYLFTLLLLFIFLPLLILLTILLYINNDGKPFFFQQRGGKGQSIFKIIKFRTMNDKKDINGQLLPDGERLTKLGALVRKTSFDELPQLFNILKGEMSLVGPRPLTAVYLDIYDDFQKQRHNVKPGITGWAQVNGRNNLSWSQKFKLDVWYVENSNFFLDLRIFLLTMVKFFKFSDVNMDGQATAVAFNGKN
ncbi:sugar transferase [Croceitalea rosinachiae]|uniref:Sugar transferase n=1 Tax=Croceitalea rosinachiae TaxID=3075596 RepID=A0ABU3ACC1_9FLAO|nr:sugar transferase [Croceitalea sp. F388]MDT0607839.1 sugar transferase [Croceitalea sp. F388]